MKVHISDVIVPERLRKLDIIKVDELAQSIKQIGLLQPIVIDTDNNLLAGNHRLEAFNNIGYDRIECKIVNLPELKRKLVEIDDNLCHSDLDFLEKAEHIALKETILKELGIRATAKERKFSNVNIYTTNELADEMEISKRKYQWIKQIHKIDATARLMLKNSPIANNLDALLLIERLDDGLQLEVATRIQKGYDGNTKRLIKDIQNEIQQNKVLARLNDYENYSDEKVQLFQGEFQQVSQQQIPDASVDFIFTDPPYQEIMLYQDLAKLAKRVLVDGGLCLCYIYQSRLQEVLNAMATHLTYNWLICAKNGGNNGRDGYGWFVEYSPILVMVKGEKRKNSQFAADFVQSQPSSKIYHEWEQSQVESSYYISKLTDVGDVVLDMMMGSATTGLSACKLNRRFIGIEKDERTFGIAKGRITNRDKDCH